MPVLSVEQQRDLCPHITPFATLAARSTLAIPYLGCKRSYTGDQLNKVRAMLGQQRGGTLIAAPITPFATWLPDLPSPPLSAQGAKGPGSDTSTIVSVDRPSRTSPRVLSDADPGHDAAARGSCI